MPDICDGATKRFNNGILDEPQEKRPKAGNTRSGVDFDQRQEKSWALQVSSATTPTSTPMAANALTPTTAPPTTNSKAKNATKKPGTTLSALATTPIALAAGSAPTGPQSPLRFRMRI